MKTLLLVVIALIGVTLMGVLVSLRRQTPAVTAWSSGPTIERLESLSELVCLRVHVADILVGENDTYRGSWLVKGDGVLAIDLHQAKIVECDKATRCARIRLPAPMVRSARIDHDKSRTWDVQRTSWVPWMGNPDQLRDEAMRQAQRLIQSSSGSIANVQLAKQSARTVIAEFYRLLDWQVTVDWTDPGERGVR